MKKSIKDKVGKLIFYKFKTYNNKIANDYCRGYIDALIVYEVLTRDEGLNLIDYVGGLYEEGEQ